MFHRILLAIDDTDSRQTGISFAAALATQHASPVRVVHVNQFLAGGRGFTVLTGAEAQSLVDDTVIQLREAGVEASGHTSIATSFNLERKIIEAAEDWSADVIVLGSHRRRRLTRLAGLGVRDRVTRLTHLPVLTAPAPLVELSEPSIFRSLGDSVAKHLHHAHSGS